MRLRLVLLLVAAAVAVAGTATTLASRMPASSTVKPPKPTYYQDVKRILDARCAGCHYTGGIAPFAPRRTRRRVARDR